MLPSKASTPLFAPFERDGAFNDLLALMRSERPPIALVGAGASSASGYPAWKDLLTNLRQLALRNNKRDWRRSVEDTSDAPWTAELFANRLAPGALGRFIRRHYGSKSTLAEPHLSLARMRFPHFLTTNYDPSIEEALKLAGRAHHRIVWPGHGNAAANRHDHEALSDFLIGLGRRDAECRVVYMHGRFDSHEDRIVLTESDYVARYIASDDARRKLMAIFMTHPVVFVGFSMNDPDLANLMREVTARLKTKTASHFALMSYKATADKEATTARMVGKFGIRPVFYHRAPAEDGSGDHANLLKLLDALADNTARDLSPIEVRLPSTTAAPVDPDDPHKGQFGGLAVARGRRLSVARTGGSQDDGYLELQFVVEPTSEGSPLSDGVEFFLHPTFKPDVYSRKIRSGRATLTTSSYGAFTIGAVTDGGATRLELDLADDLNLPKWFRRQ